MSKSNCLICERINMIKEEKNPYFVAELETGYVVIGDHQFFKGYTLFLCKEHMTELHFLEEAFKIKYLEEMSKVAEAVYNAFKPDKLNYELLGNGDSHIHWHIFPRREGDMPERGPVWWLDRSIMFSKDVMPNEFELIEMKAKLVKELESLTSIKNKG
jgi:diadenosine tetraphosphate (Ap4A) HIT family hydrolase